MHTVSHAARPSRARRAVNSAPSRYQPLSAYALKPRLLRCPCRGVAFAPPAPLASCTLGHSMRESCCPILNSPWRSPERPPRLAIAGCGAVSLVWQVVVYCAFFLKTNLYIVAACFFSLHTPAAARKIQAAARARPAGPGPGYRDRAAQAAACTSAGRTHRRLLGRQADRLCRRG